MRHPFISASLFVGLALVSGQARADEAPFLKSISGNFVGGGTVRLRTSSAPISVKCSFQSKSGTDNLMLSGRCRGLLIVSRSVSADIRVRQTRYSGTYVGAGTGTANLSGRRFGDRITFAIRWAKDVNGDRDAVLTVQRTGPGGLRLTTTDRDPKNGSLVNTSELNLTRQ